MKRAYSYIRFSSLQQAKGASLARQQEGTRWATANGYSLDDTLTFKDLGVSAFRGKNAIEGELAAFITAVDDGRIAKGSALIVESLDRLSRQEVPDALELFLGILRRGITIVTLIPTPVVFSKKDLDTTQLIIAIVMLSRSHEESAVKSERHTYNWSQFRKRMNNGEAIGKICPKWLVPSQDGKKFVPHPEKAPVIKLIFKLYLQGNGTSLISNILNDAGHPPLGHGKKWTASQVAHVLRNRQVIGERQCHRKIDGKLIPEGEPIKDYFPRIIKEDDFLKVQHLMSAKHQGKVGRRGKHVNNLFTNLIFGYNWCDKKGKGEMPAWSLHTAQDHPTLTGPRPKPVGNKRKYHIPYKILEDAILSQLKELDIKDLLDDGHSLTQQLQTAEAKLHHTNTQLTKLQLALRESDDVSVLVSTARELEQEKKALTKHVEALRQEATNSKTEQLADLQELIGKCKSDVDLRRKLKARLHQTISEIIIQIDERTSRDRTVSLLINFRHFAKVRWVVLDLTAGGNGRESTATVRTATIQERLNLR